MKKLSSLLIWLTAIFSLGPAIVLAEDCMSPDKLKQLENNETTYMLGRIPPAFRHGLEDKRITMQLRVEADNSNSICKVREVITIPQEEISEAELVLEQDTAKRILLFSQGYSLPSSETLEASFAADPISLEIEHRDTLQSGELGKLRASLEMMYAMLSQSRAVKIESADAIKPWSVQFKLKNQKSCQLKFPSEGNAEQVCECLSFKLSQRYSERKLDYLDYVLSNPYAKATGLAEDYEKELGEIYSNCRLEPT